MLAPGMTSWLWRNVPKHRAFILRKGDTTYIFKRNYYDSKSFVIEKQVLVDWEWDTNAPPSYRIKKWSFREEPTYKIIKTLMKKKGYKERI